MSRSSSERVLFSIWVGYFASGAVMTEVDRLLIDSVKPYYASLYAHQTIGAGLAFFIMGGVYWGRFYSLGATYFVLALLMPIWPEFAPLAYGGAWVVALGLIARHLSRLAKEAGDPAKTGKIDLIPTRPAPPPMPLAPPATVVKGRN